MNEPILIFKCLVGAGGRKQKRTRQTFFNQHVYSFTLFFPTPKFTAVFKKSLWTQKYNTYTIIPVQ